MAERIVLFGGTFNPIHHGHLIVAGAVAEQLRLSRVVFIPSANPPHKQGHNLADAAESDLRPRAELTDIGSLHMLALGGRSLWFYLTLIAAGLIVTEWWLYQRRIVG